MGPQWIEFIADGERMSLPVDPVDPGHHRIAGRRKAIERRGCNGRFVIPKLQDAVPIGIG